MLNTTCNSFIYHQSVIFIPSSRSAPTSTTSWNEVGAYTICYVRRIHKTALYNRVLQTMAAGQIWLADGFHLTHVLDQNKQVDEEQQNVVIFFHSGKIVGWVVRKWSWNDKNGICDLWQVKISDNYKYRKNPVLDYASSCFVMIVYDLKIYRSYRHIGTWFIISIRVDVDSWTISDRNLCWWSWRWRQFIDSSPTTPYSRYSRIKIPSDLQEK